MNSINLKVLQLESEIKKMRIDLAEQYLLNNGIKPSLCDETDKMSIYAMLTIKAEKFKKESLDKCM